MRLRVPLLLAVARIAAGCVEPPPPAPSEPTPRAPETVAPLPPCDPGLDAGSFAYLKLESMGRDVAPGERVPLRVGYYTSPDVPFEPVAACVRWTVAEADMATLDPASGVLTVLPGAKGTLHLRGTVAQSASPVEAELTVIGEDLAPILGAWKEASRLDCETHRWAEPQRPIVSIRLQARGELVMTWTWADFQDDYVARYTWNQGTRRMTLQITAGKYPPPDVRKQGTARIERGALILEGIWLGGTRYAGEAAGCGHRFVRY